MPGGKKVIVSGRFQVVKVYFWGGNGRGLFFSCACKIVQKHTSSVYNITNINAIATLKINFCHLGETSGGGSAIYVSPEKISRICLTY